MKTYNITAKPGDYRSADLRIEESDNGNWVEKKDVESLLQFHADIVAARQQWWEDGEDYSDDRYIEAIFQALLKHNPDFEKDDQ